MPTLGELVDKFIASYSPASKGHTYAEVALRWSDHLSAMGVTGYDTTTVRREDQLNFQVFPPGNEDLIMYRGLATIYFNSRMKTFYVLEY